MHSDASPQSAGRRVLVSIVSYRNENEIAKCLESVIAAPSPALEVWVALVDNSPDDATWARVQHWAQGRDDTQRVVTVRSDGNIGWSRGNNLGVREALRRMRAEPDFVVLLNPDAELLPGALASAVADMERERNAGILGGYVGEANGAMKPNFWPDWKFRDVLLEFAGIRRFRTRLLYQRMRRGSAKGSVRGGFPSGSAMVLRWEPFRTAGLLDERYFLYFDDADIAESVRRQGWEVICSPDFAVTHLGGASSDRLSEGLAASHVRKTLVAIESQSEYFSKWMGGGFGRFVRWYAFQVNWRFRSHWGKDPLRRSVAREVVRTGNAPPAP